MRRCSRILHVGETHYVVTARSEEHTSELQSLTNLVCRLLLEKKKKKIRSIRRVERIRRPKMTVMLATFNTSDREKKICSPASLSLQCSSIVRDGKIQSANTA